MNVTRAVPGAWARATWTVVVLVLLSRATAAQEEKPFVPFGIFIGSIEEGARIFTPTRLLPLEHPEALGHDFPTTPVHHIAEARALVFLGEQVGLHLGPTLQRYPGEPTDAWPYPEFAPPPSALLLAAPVTRAEVECSPVPGARVIAYAEGNPLAFIIDTRGMSLAARNMTRPTSAGLDVTRVQFLAGLAELSKRVQGEGVEILVIEGSPPACSAAGNAGT